MMTRRISLLSIAALPLIAWGLASARTAPKAAPSDCCYPGAPCCEAEEACCAVAVAEVKPAPKADCCTEGEACCEVDAACCDAK